MTRITDRNWARWALLVAGWFASRMVLIVIGTVPLPFYPGGTLVFDDLTVYARWLPTIRAGVLPTDDMWQYPPLSALFFQLGDIGPYPRSTLLLAIVAVDLVLTIVVARYAMRAGWYWVLAGLAIGPVLVSRFDVVPTLFAVLAVLAVARPVRTGAWAAVGAALKVWPVLVLAVVPRRKALPAAGGFLVVGVAVLVVSATVFDRIGGFLGGQGSRGLQVESVGALPFLILNMLGFPVTMGYRYGAMEITSDGAGIMAVIVTVLALVGFGWAAVGWWNGRLHRVPAADIAFTLVAFSVVVSRVFSPQYSVWLLGLGVLALVTPGSVVRLPVVLVAVAAVLAQLIYPMLYGSMLAGDVLAVALQTLRIGLVVAAVVIAGYRIAIQPSPHAEAVPAPQLDDAAQRTQ